MWRRWAAGPALVLCAVLGCQLGADGLAPVQDGGVDATVDGGAPDVAVGDVQAPPDDAGADVEVDARAADPSNVTDAGLRVWLRDNVGLADGGAPDAGGPATAWFDQSGHVNDCTAMGPPPTYVPSAPEFAGRPALEFTAFGLGNPSVAMPQPFSVFVVGSARKVANNPDFFDSMGSGSSRVGVFATVNTAQLLLYTGGNGAMWLTTKDVSAPAVMVAVFAGSNSVVYVSSDFSTDGGPLDSSSLSGLLVGGDGVGPTGRIAEFALWSSILDAVAVKRLNAYASARYGISVAH